VSNTPKNRTRPPSAPAPDGAGAVDEVATAHVSWWRRFLSRPNYLGLVVAALAFQWSLTPSLLPRPWLFEGMIAGIGAALGYGLGCFLSWLIRKTPLRERGPVFKHRAWIGLAIVAPIYLVVSLLLGVGWQNEVRTLVGMEDEGLITALEVAVVAVPVAIGCWLLGRALRRLNRWIARHLGRFIPRPVAWTGAVVIVGAVIYFAVTGVIFNAFVAAMNNIYSGTNASTRDGIEQPKSALRSGSRASFSPWDTLGMEGRNFVARGPNSTEISNFTGKPALQPIRVYVGLDGADTAAARAKIAVQELERTDAFSRKVLVVAGTTGTGWLEPQSVNSVEYEWGGDSAIVGIQYSFLPSWISTLVDADKAKEAGNALFDAVYAEWVKLPEASRPKLIAYGLSLGSFSIQGAFPDAADLTARTQGAVLVGSPNFSQPWGQISVDRAAGSPQWQPVYQDGAQVRFAAVPTDLAKPSGTWGPPRVAYVQHANDPVVWWSPALLIKVPDWLVEPPGPGRTPTMRYYPILTFLQVTVDQFTGVDVPQGQGHNYGTAMPAAFAQVTQPPGWTDADTVRLEKLIATLPVE
jgi:uncharacterized membrane protein